MTGGFSKKRKIEKTAATLASGGRISRLNTRPAQEILEEIEGQGNQVTKEEIREKLNKYELTQDECDRIAHSIYLHLQRKGLIRLTKSRAIRRRAAERLLAFSGHTQGAS